MNPAFKRLVPGPIRNVLREFSWPPALVHWLPGNSRQFGPPRRWQRLSEYFSGHPGELRTVTSALPFVLAQPTVIGEFPARFLSSGMPAAPAGQVFTLRGASLLGPEGWVIAPVDTFLLDAGSEANDPRLRLADYHVFRARRGAAKPRRRLSGRCLSLASDYAIGGFGHFIHDSLSRLFLIDRAGLEPSDFDWVYLPRPDTPVVRELVDRLGLKPGQLLSHDPACDLDCEELTATRFPGSPGYVSPPCADYLRARFAPIPQRRNRRVYLSRRGFRRNFANAPGIDAVLRQHGFEEVCPHADPATLQKCVEAEFVFSLEGANFINALFCPAGTRVLLVFPEGLPHSLPFALSLAGAAGLLTCVMSAETVGPAGLDGGIADVHLDPAKLDHALRVLGAA